MVLGHGELGVDGAAVTGGQTQMEPGRVLGTAAEAPPVVGAERRPRRRGIEVPHRGDGVGRGVSAAADGHGFDPTEAGQPPGCKADRVVFFEERLRAPWWLWVLTWAWPLMLGIAYGYATNAVVGTLVAVGAAALGTAALVRTAPIVTVDDTGWRAGRAYLEAEYLGEVAALDPAAARQLRGVDADASAYVLLRGWVSTAVRCDVADARDPTPYWYVSTRRPNALVMALTQARDNARHDVEGFGRGPAAPP